MISKKKERYIDSSREGDGAMVGGEELVAAIAAEARVVALYQNTIGPRRNSLLIS